MINEGYPYLQWQAETAEEPQEPNGGGDFMSLRLFFDAEATNQISEDTAVNPDIVRGNVTNGMTDILPLWVKSTNEQYTYEEITITSAQGNVDGVLFSYALDNGSGEPDEGTWSETLELPDGDYDSSYPIHRRIEIEPRETPFTSDVARHRIQALVFNKL